MTLRDYFAAAAMAAIVGHNAQPMVACLDGVVPNMPYIYLASEAYRMADAMIDERKADNAAEPGQ